jgi:hypothetical protein
MIPTEPPDHDPIIAFLPTRARPARGLGRYISHDPRSRVYPVTVDAPIGPVLHDRFSSWLDQGELGSCTGNAGTGMLGSAPFSTTAKAARIYNESYAVKLYADATRTDDVSGYYPPMDTGSSGLAIAKVLRARGIIDRYEHAFSVRAALTALQRAPILIGSVWLSGMDQPDAHGFVQLSGSVEGGHEYFCREYEPGATFDTGVLTCDNSWSKSWGDWGRFRLTVAQFGYLLKQQGDVTAPVPLS